MKNIKKLLTLSCIVIACFLFVQQNKIVRASGDLQLVQNNDVVYVSTNEATASADTIVTVSASTASARIGWIGTPTGYASSFGGLINFILRLALGIGALLVFANLLIGGIEYITSGGEKGKTEAARNKITASIVGLIILASSWAILNLALGFLGFRDINDVIRMTGTINSPGATDSAMFASTSAQLRQLNILK